MAPIDYIQARERNKNHVTTTTTKTNVNNNNNNNNDDDDNNDQDYYCIIDDYPYYPFHHVDVNDMNSIKFIVYKISMINSLLRQKEQQEHTNGDHCNNNDNGEKKNEMQNMDEKVYDNEYENFVENISSLYQVEKVSGGVTNTLFKVSSIQNDNNDNNNTDDNHNHNNSIIYLVRIFGAEGMINRDDENSTYAALAKCSIAPPYYGRFQNGRMEGFCQTGRVLCTKDLQGGNGIGSSNGSTSDSLNQNGNHKSSSKRRTITNEIAEAMAELHVNFIIPVHLQSLHDIHAPSTLWKQIYDWYEQAINDTNIPFQNDRDATIANELQLQSLYTELIWLQKDIIPHDSPLVFSHNDLLAANILYDENGISLTTSTTVTTTTSETATNNKKKNNNKCIQLIDFEYGGINYAFFDVANHWNEYAGGPPYSPIPDYTLLPNEEQQYHFCSAYLRTIQYFYSSKSKGQVVEEHPNPYIPTLVNQYTIEQMMEQIQCFQMVNHLYWGLWSINQTKTEGCMEFDYIIYGQQRIQQYWISKEQYLNKIQNNNKI